MTISPLWIPATKIHRLIQCLASGESSGAAITMGRQMSRSTDIGSIAHRALERWAGEGLWREDLDGTMLRRTYELEGRKSHKDVNVQPGGRLLGVRIKNVGRSLRVRLSTVQPDQIFPELSVEDDVTHIRGVIDLLIVEDHAVHIYDYKTGRGALTGDGEVSESVRSQLVAYGILVSRLYPKHQLRLSMVSPSHGIIDVPYDVTHASRIKERVREFQLLADGQRDLRAQPDRENCRFCARRLRCEPHWKTAIGDGWTDVAEGDVIDWRWSDNGELAIAIETNDGVAWVLNVVPGSMDGLPEGVPLRLRGVRLQRLRPEGASGVHYRSTIDSEVTVWASGGTLRSGRDASPPAPVT